MSLSKKTRRMSHKNLLHREDAELNLVPLIDILSVMVAFLLVYSVDVEVIQNAKGVEIPQSIAETQPKQSVVVMITKDQLFVQGELITSLDEIRADKSPMIESLRRVLERPLIAGDAVPEDPTAATAREITLMGDKSLPYDVVKKVMATCTAAAYGKISLAVMEKERPAHVAGAKPA
jgi:biopolymer transport protein ExbD